MRQERYEIFQKKDRACTACLAIWIRLDKSRECEDVEILRKIANVLENRCDTVCLQCAQAMIVGREVADADRSSWWLKWGATRANHLARSESGRHLLITGADMRTMKRERKIGKYLSLKGA